MKEERQQSRSRGFHMWSGIKSVFFIG
jgi:hypothetical protein